MFAGAAATAFGLWLGVAIGDHGAQDAQVPRGGSAQIAVVAPLKDLAAASQAELQRLGDATNASQQAHAAERLAALHERGATVLAQAVVPRRLEAQKRSVIANVERLAAGYEQLAAAARGGHEAAYGAGQLAIGRAEARLREAIGGLKRS
jgi:hypothetical protein